MMVHGNGAFGDFTEVALPSDLVGVRTSWSKTMTIDATQVVHITTTTDAQLMATIGGEGATTWKSLTGSIHGTSFIPPTQEGYVLLSNPNEEPATVTWRGSGVTIDALSSYSVAWPPADLDCASMMQSDRPISVVWSGASSPVGVYQMGAVDTGMESGLRVHSNTSNTFSLELKSNGDQSIVNISTLTTNETILNQSESLIVSVDNQQIIVETEEGHGVYAFADHGAIGFHDSIHEGARRCVSIDVTASVGLT